MTKHCTQMYDIFIIGGGVNGCGIARDASGRGLSVALAEQGDLAQATSSASTKLFHGGLRYLEYYEFGLVRAALREREILLSSMPHISWPMPFVLPHHKGLRPRWLLRLGLFLYDHLGGRRVLPATKVLDLRSHYTGKVLKNGFTTGFEYSDCWVQDARLVALNARDAAERGANIMTRSRVIRAERFTDHWEVLVEDTGTGKTTKLCTRTLINAAGPWVGQVLNEILAIQSKESVRLVRGSHIVTRRLFEHDQPYILQGADGRVIFAIPYEQDFTLIGTTDLDHDGPPGEAQCSDEEAEYLCAFVSDYFREPVTLDDVVWRFSGVRPLYADGAGSATEATREYVLSLEQEGGARLLNIFGGKITTYRRLAEAALAKLGYKDEWTAGVTLPGGDFPVGGVEKLTTGLRLIFPFLSESKAYRLVTTYGTEAAQVLGKAKTPADLGQDFGAGLYEAEVRWLMKHEFAMTAEDILWRRTKLGLLLDDNGVRMLDEWIVKEREASS